MLMFKERPPGDRDAPRLADLRAAESRRHPRIREHSSMGQYAVPS